MSLDSTTSGASLIAGTSSRPNDELAIEATKAILQQALSAAQPKGYQRGVDPKLNARPGLLSFQAMSDIYDRNDLVRAIVDLKRRQICGLDWDVQPQEDIFVPWGLDEEVEQLLRCPNESKESWWSLMMKMTKDLFVVDAGAIEKVRGASGKPEALYCLDGSTIFPQVDEHGVLKGYKQIITDSLGGTKHETLFEPDDLIYFVANPTTSRIFGQSPLETLAFTVGADIYALAHNVSNFTDGNLADNILILGKIGEQALLDLRGFFEDSKGKGHQLPIASNVEGTAALLKLQSSNRDMEFMQFAAWVFQRICAVYQVSADEVIQLQAHLTRAAGEQQRDIHENKSTGPECRLIEERLTQEVCWEFDPDLCFIFTEKNRTDDLAEAQVWEIMAKSGRPMNEIRQERGFKPLDMPLIKMNGKEVCLFDFPLNPTTWLPMGWEALPEGKPKVPPAPGGLPFGGGGALLNAPAGSTPPGVHFQRSRRARKAGRLITVTPFEFDSPQVQGLVKQLSGRLVPLWDQWEAQTMDLLERSRSAFPEQKTAKMTHAEHHALMDVAGDAGKYLEDLLKTDGAIADAIAATLRQAAVAVSDQISLSFSEDMFNQVASEYAREHAYEDGVLRSISDTSKELLGNNLSAAVESGASFNQAKESIRELFEGLKDWQIQRIAKTEIGTANRRGGIEACEALAQKHGLTIEGYQLIPTEMACEKCVTAAAMTVAQPVDKSGVSDIEDEFLHPNCNCMWSTIVSGGDEAGAPQVPEAAMAEGE